MKRRILVAMRKKQVSREEKFPGMPPSRKDLFFLERREETDKRVKFSKSGKLVELGKLIKTSQGTMKEHQKWGAGVKNAGI